MMKKNMYLSRIRKRPQYKIGDVVVYIDPYHEDESMGKIIQSKIVESYGLIEKGDGVEDQLSWYYITSEMDKYEGDSLEEGKILYKLI